MTISFFLIYLSAFLMNFSHASEAHIVFKKQIGPDIEITKIECDGHTYLHIYHKNLIGSATNTCLHDPSCRCFKHKIRK